MTGSALFGAGQRQFGGRDPKGQLVEIVGKLDSMLSLPIFEDLHDDGFILAVQVGPIQSQEKIGRFLDGSRFAGGIDVQRFAAVFAVGP